MQMVKRSIKALYSIVILSVCFQLPSERYNFLRTGRRTDGTDGTDGILGLYRLIEIHD